jgi:NAD(P)-dependent dehydrogenase (short-subunit alcohol dehydrogenase family)
MTANQVVLITGAGRGIGRAAADRFVELGATVIGTSRTDAGAARITDSPDGRRQGIRFDLTEPGGDDAFAAAVRAITDHVDLLVCNAGVMVEADDITEQSLEDFRTVLDVNLTGAFRTVRATLPLLRTAGNPRVITLHGGLGNVSSGMEGGGCIAYRASKAGIAALTMTLAEEESESGVLACGYDPGWVATDLGGDDAPRKPAECADELVALAERMRPEELTGRLVRGSEIVPW